MEFGEFLELFMFMPLQWMEQINYLLEVHLQALMEH